MAKRKVLNKENAEKLEKTYTTTNLKEYLAYYVDCKDFDSKQLNQSQVVNRCPCKAVRHYVSRLSQSCNNSLLSLLQGCSRKAWLIVNHDESNDYLQIKQTMVSLFLVTLMPFSGSSFIPLIKIFGARTFEMVEDVKEVNNGIEVSEISKATQNDVETKVSDEYMNIDNCDNVQVEIEERIECNGFHQMKAKILDIWK
uniref:Uncharacterized protein n=1 Tax=Glossina pallidipes TaxID=7398 RepID=A0A1A9ZCN2_GLOPL